MNDHLRDRVCRCFNDDRPDLDSDPVMADEPIAAMTPSLQVSPTAAHHRRREARAPVQARPIASQIRTALCNAVDVRGNIWAGERA